MKHPNKDDVRQTYEDDIKGFGIAGSIDFETDVGNRQSVFPPVILCGSSTDACDSRLWYLLYHTDQVDRAGNLGSDGTDRIHGTILYSQAYRFITSQS